jgi:hypothetical protein
MCAKGLRSQFHAALCADGLVFHQPFTLCSAIAWLNDRKCKVSFLDIEIPEEYSSTSRSLLEWLNKFGSYVRFLQARTLRTRTKPRAFALSVCTNCINLERFSSTSDMLDDLVVLIPLLCKKVTHLFIKVDDDCVNEYILNMISTFCTNVTHLYIDGQTDAIVDWRFVSRLKIFHYFSFHEDASTLSRSQQITELSLGSLTGAKLTQVLQHCPNLTYLGCLDAKISVADLEAVKTRLDRLHTLLLGTWKIYDHASYDDEILSLLRHAKQLRSLLCGVHVLSLMPGSWGERYDRMIFNQQDESRVASASEVPFGMSPLQELYVAALSEAAMLKVLTMCPQLRLLHVERLPYDLGRLLVRQGVHLQLQLDLTKVTAQQLEHLSHTSGIVELNLQFAKGDATPSLEEQLRACCELNRFTLCRLNLRYCGNHISDGAALVMRLPRLEQVCVAKEYGAVLRAERDPLFQRMKLACPRLRYLQIDI